MAALINAAVGIEPDLVVGARGEFTVRLGAETVAKKDASGFPADEDVVAAVRRAVASKPGA